MNRLGLSIIGAVCIIGLLYALLAKGIIHISDISSAIAPALVTAFVGVLVWGVTPIVGRYLRRNQQNTEGEISAKKRSRWVSKLLRRAPVKKENRRNFWERVVIMVFLGAMIIGMSLSFSSTSVKPEAMPTFLAAKYAMTGFGIVVLIVFAWLGITEVVAMWDVRSQSIATRKAAQLSFFKEFDDALEAVQEVHERNLKLDMLYRFHPKLSALCNSNYSWVQLKDRVDKVFELIPEKLSNESHVYVGFLYLLVRSFGEHVTSTIRNKWLEELESLYDDPNYNTVSIPYVLYMLQELHGYDRNYIMKLIDDASANWTPLKFQLLASNIDFSQMKKREPLAHKAILSYLRRKMDDAAKNKKEEACDRLKFLYNNAEER
jgi:hypothetical protein